MMKGQGKYFDRNGEVCYEFKYLLFDNKQFDQKLHSSNKTTNILYIMHFASWDIIHIVFIHNK